MTKIKCKISSKVMDKKKIGKNGYSKEAWNHYQCVNKKLVGLNKRKLKIHEYRELMGYPPLERRRRTPPISEETLAKALKIVEE
tara:strand:+ start:356 stop:607 length:252 start_codon:yes stop_codon:yes gene_type:complete